MLALMSLGVSQGCGDGNDTTAPVQQPTLVVTVTLNSIAVPQDCDFAGFPATIWDNDSEGEFQYRFWVSWPDGSDATMDHTEHLTDKVRRGGSGTIWPDGRVDRRILDGPGPYTVYLHFWATEWDSYLGGLWGEDEFLNHQSKSLKYTFRTGDVISGNAAGSISLGNDPDNYSKCHIKASFTIRTVEGTRR